jgi:hypothetical protein
MAARFPLNITGPPRSKDAGKTTEAVFFFVSISVFSLGL